MKPTLLLDVDGVLNPYAAKPHKRPDGYDTYYVHQDTFAAYSSSERNAFHKNIRKRLIRVWLNPQHGEWLNTLDQHFNVTWCTTWNDEANKVIAPRINSAQFPVLTVENSFRSMNGLHWKTIQLLNNVGGHTPFAWVDDELTKNDVAFFSAHCGAEFKLLKINPAVGLTADDVETLVQWAENLRSDKN